MVITSLDRFAKGKLVVVPIVAGWGQYKSRKLVFKNVEDDFYMVELGEEPRIVRKAMLVEKRRAFDDRSQFAGYALGTELIPVSFESLKSRSLGQSLNINFLNSPTFTAIIVAEWEDGRFYYVQDCMIHNLILRNLKTLFDSQNTLKNVKGITPELRYYFMLCSLQQENYELLKVFQKWVNNGNFSKEEIDKRLKAFKETFKARLTYAVNQAGGRLISFAKRGRNFHVKWTVGNQIVNSIVKDNLRVVSAGYCLSGDDAKHTLPSLIHLAKMFQERSPLYITRE